MWLCFFFFFKQKTAYEMRISDWSSDVCSSDLDQRALVVGTAVLGSHLLECHRTWIRGGEADGPAAWRHGAPGLAGGIARAALAEQSTELHQPGHEMPRPDEIGRASSRERVCQYV